MEKNVGNINNLKNEIISFIKDKGPCLPNEIAKKINKQLLITSAILSEMVRENRIKITCMKIGSSPLYLLTGQEAQLERYFSFLKDKEKEAIDMLKKNKILDNSKIDPSIRVALNNLKDFAIPIKIKAKNEEKIFWKYFLVDNKEVEEIIKNLEKFNIKKEVKNEVKENEEERKDKVKEIQKKIEIEGKKEIIKEKIKENKKEIKVSNFEEYINKNFGLIEKISNNMFSGTKEILGEIIEFLILIKDKKRISDADLLLALKEGQERKMLVVILTKGNLTKKAKKILEDAGSMIIIKNLNE